MKEKVLKLLPDEYQQVEYLESTGTQYIDTRYIPSESTSIETIAKLNKTDSARDGALFGVRSARGYDDFICWYNNLNNSNIDAVGIIILGSININSFDGQFSSHKIEYKEKSFYVDNSLIGTYMNNIRSNNLRLFLLALNENNVADSRGFYGKLYYCKINNEGAWVRDFIPCYSTTTVTDVNGKECPKGTVGMYDTVEGKFYTNQGTGEFIKGPDV